jgi:putative phosphoesterase
MKIGVMADTHDCQQNTQSVLAKFRLQDIRVIIHCGDMTSAKTAALFSGFRAIHVLGNGDLDASREIRSTLLKVNPENFSGPTFTGEIDNIAIAVIHGDKDGELQQLIHSGLYRYVFHGHSHLQCDKPIGDCRVINPGALGGRKPEKRSALIFDLQSGESFPCNP